MQTPLQDCPLQRDQGYQGLRQQEGILQILNELYKQWEKNNKKDARPKEYCVAFISYTLMHITCSEVWVSNTLTLNATGANMQFAPSFHVNWQLWYWEG